MTNNIPFFEGSMWKAFSNTFFFFTTSRAILVMSRFPMVVCHAPPACTQGCQPCDQPINTHSAEGHTFQFSPILPVKSFSAIL